jgi:signal transduction histidine kinase
VDNALRHNVPGGHIEVVTGTRDSRAVLSVINTGPLVPAEAIGRLLQPFQRLAPDRTGHGDSLGLGLSIAQAIARAHEAALTLRPQPSGGLRVEVSFQQPTAKWQPTGPGAATPSSRRLAHDQSRPTPPAQAS